MTTKENTNQEQLVSTVIDRGVCTGCGACVELCPYMKTHNAATVALFKCDRETGRCHTYCPRTETQLDELQKAMFDPADLTKEIGAFKGLYMTRATDPAIREKSQHGGTVTALTILALEEGIINSCVLADQDEKMLSKSFTATSKEEIIGARGSKFGNCPTVAEFNRVSKKDGNLLGVVATPCQALALAKMRTYPAENDVERMDRLKLVIGLFCGWTLDWRKLSKMVLAVAGDEEILNIDIPPSKYACMQVTTAKGILEIPIDEVNETARECCDYCDDMTAEFSDLSVGSARSKDGWDVDKGWNQVVVRSELGEKLMNIAKEKGILEFKEFAPGNIDKLKSASGSKKGKGQSNLAEVRNTKEN
jgi:coenzyme F420 hydrogenase subunit beta